MCFGRSVSVQSIGSDQVVMTFASSHQPPPHASLGHSDGVPSRRIAPVSSAHAPLYLRRGCSPEVAGYPPRHTPTGSHHRRCQAQDRRSGKARPIAPSPSIGTHPTVIPPDRHHSPHWDGLTGSGRFIRSRVGLPLLHHRKAHTAGRYRLVCARTVMGPAPFLQGHSLPQPGIAYSQIVRNSQENPMVGEGSSCSEGGVC